MSLGTPLLDALDRMGFGGLILNTDGEVLRANETATALLGQTREIAGLASPDWNREAIKSLLRSKHADRFRLHEENWVALRREDGSRPLVLRAVPLGERDPSGAQSVLILYDLEHAPEPSWEAVQKLFQLTPAEAHLALDIAAGRGPDDIAELRGISVRTIRKQLSSVFLKTNTRKQAELVALLARVSILP
jgi:DNA-binding CsgD family transcriptional regulator